MVCGPTDAVPYLPVERHGVIGDRQSAALIAADGTIDWLCLPDYAGDVIFGSLLDWQNGGLWRLGPARLIVGQQIYREHTATLLTTWTENGSHLELADTMSRPCDKSRCRPNPRALLRRLSCRRGRVSCAMTFSPRLNFLPAAVEPVAAHRISLHVRSHQLELWSTFPITAALEAHPVTFELAEGEEAWAIFALDSTEHNWTVSKGNEVVQQSEAYWKEWLAHLNYKDGPPHIATSAMMIHLLSFAPDGSIVAAATTSLPARIGGDCNYDYRFTWVRDASLAIESLPRLGNTTDGEHYLNWLTRVGSSTASPFQVVYGVHGELDLTEQDRRDLHGYRESLPVRFGNHAFQQQQLDTLGYLVDCTLTHLQRGGKWRPEYWTMVRRIGDFISSNWHQGGNSIWELPAVQHYLSGKVMSWVALDRGLKIAEKTGQTEPLKKWRVARDAIHADVLKNGWSDRLRAFRQRYEAENLDAAALLIPLVGLLPPDDPRVVSTVARVESDLCINGLVHRFIPEETPGMTQLPLGEYEASFVPCTLWLATAYAKLGRVDKAKAIIHHVEEVAGPLGLFAEGIDARCDSFRGNYPLIFSHAEYIRASLEADQAASRI